MQQKATTKNKQTYFSYNVIIFIPENKISNSVQVFLVFIIIIIIIIFFIRTVPQVPLVPEIVKVPQSTDLQFSNTL